MLALKSRILDNQFGAPVALKCYISWPRDWKYYTRWWAGKIRTDAGEAIHDSIISNATAHYIQNMLFLTGDSMGESAALRDIAIECYRANDIESFDTIAFRGSAGNADVFFTASHATHFAVEPVMVYVFEKASVLVNLFNQDRLCAIHHRNGTVEHLGDALGDGMRNKLLYTAREILGETEKGEAFICTASTSKPFTAFIDAVFDQAPFYAFPREMVVKDSAAGKTYVKNLHWDLYNCFNQAKLPSELGLPWAEKAVIITP
jgi:hypothetical protein